VLLVDHDEAELAESGRSSTSACVPTTRWISPPRRPSPAAPFAAAERAGHRAIAEPRARQQSRAGAEVLLGEDLGGRHERDLLSVLHRHDRGQHGDDRLAGADVTLQQPVHRPGTLHVRYALRAASDVP
jgi:hypothetical protein